MQFIYDDIISQVWDIISLYLILLKAFQSNLKLPDFSNQFMFPLAPNFLNFSFPSAQSNTVNFTPDFLKYPFFKPVIISLGISKNWVSTV